MGEPTVSSPSTRAAILVGSLVGRNLSLPPVRPWVTVEPVALLERQDLPHLVEHHRTRDVTPCVRVLDAFDQRLCVVIVGGSLVEQHVQLSIEGIEFLPLCTTCSQGRLEDVVDF